MSESIHNVPGRLRVKIPDIRAGLNKERELFAQFSFEIIILSFYFTLVRTRLPPVLDIGNESLGHAGGS